MSWPAMIGPAQAESQLSCQNKETSTAVLTNKGTDRVAHVEAAVRRC